jgi:type I restriction enzyme S subunit
MKGRFVDRTIDNITAKAVEQSSTNLLKEGALLIVVRSGILQHSIPAAINRVPVALNQDMKALRFNEQMRVEFAQYFVIGNQRPLLLEWCKEGATVESIEQEYLGISRTPIPPLPEQTQIAAFLDHETAKIDRLIEKQQALISLLKEKRQAVISHAVTKGLNPHAPLKDSGIEWLGQVPAHWVILALGKITLARCDGPFGSGLKSEHYTESGVRVIRLQNIKLGVYHEGDGAFIDKDYYARHLSNHDVAAGDLLIAGLGDPNNPVGRACVAPEDIAPAMVKADCFRFRLDRSKAVPGFIAQQLSISAAVDAGELANGSTRSRIPLSLMASRTVLTCPLDEQNEILDHIGRVSKKYDRLESMAAVAVALLQERRTALISAAVTGKIDVRHWQPTRSTEQ